MSVDVVAYDPSWPAAFDAIQTELTDALGSVGILAIEHVGSTAVRGLAAKPIIDIDVVVARDHTDAAIRALEDVGYRYRGELGVPDRHAMAAPEGGPDRHVYVVVDGCLALRNHLGVRDVLRADADLRRRYGRLKRALAREEQTSDDYTAAKSELLQTILERAGIGPAERSAIREINRSG